MTDRLAQIVSGHAHVAAIVWLAPSSMDDPQEEEGSAGEQHTMRAGVVAVCLNALSVFVPLHRRGRTALSLAVESGRLPFGHNEVRRVLHDAGREVFLAKTGSWKKRVGRLKELLYCCTGCKQSTKQITPISQIKKVPIKKELGKAH